MERKEHTGKWMSEQGGNSPCPNPPPVVPLDRKVVELTLGELLAAIDIGPPPAPFDDTSPEDSDRLVFDFDHVTKKEIYSHVLAILRLQGFRNSNADVIRFLAHHTNLGSEASIHAQIYLYKASV